MTIVHDLDLSAVRLLYGGHSENTEQQWCLLEAVAYVAEHTVLGPLAAETRREAVELLGRMCEVGR